MGEKKENQLRQKKSYHKKSYKWKSVTAKKKIFHVRRLFLTNTTDEFY